MREMRGGTCTHVTDPDAQLHNPLQRESSTESFGFLNKRIGCVGGERGYLSTMFKINAESANVISAFWNLASISTLEGGWGQGWKGKKEDGGRGGKVKMTQFEQQTAA